MGRWLYSQPYFKYTSNLTKIHGSQHGILKAENDSVPHPPWKHTRTMNEPDKLIQLRYLLNQSKPINMIGMYSVMVFL